MSLSVSSSDCNGSIIMNLSAELKWIYECEYEYDYEWVWIWIWGKPV